MGVARVPSYDCLFHKPAAAAHYDRCREVDSSVLVAAADAIWTECAHIFERRSEPPSGSVLEAGVGLGRLFLPVARRRPREYRSCVSVVGLDIAQPMLAGLDAQLSRMPTELTRLVRTTRCDITEPYPKLEQLLTVIYSLATFHILTEWQAGLQNAIDALAPDGRLILIKETNQFMHQTEGFEASSELESLDTVLDAFMREYHQLRTVHSMPFERTGVLYSDMSPAILGLRELGFEPRRVIAGDALRWQKAHTYDDILFTLEHGLITTWGSDLPRPVRRKVTEELRLWLTQRYVDSSATFRIPARFELHVFSRETDKTS